MRKCTHNAASETEIHPNMHPIMLQTMYINILPIIEYAYGHRLYIIYNTYNTHSWHSLHLPNSKWGYQLAKQYGVATDGVRCNWYWPMGVEFKHYVDKVLQFHESIALAFTCKRTHAHRQTDDLLIKYAVALLHG